MIIFFNLTHPASLPSSPFNAEIHIFGLPYRFPPLTWNIDSFEGHLILSIPVSLPRVIFSSSSCNFLFWAFQRRATTPWTDAEKQNGIFSLAKWHGKNMLHCYIGVYKRPMSMGFTNDRYNVHAITDWFLQQTRGTSAWATWQLWVTEYRTNYP